MKSLTFKKFNIEGFGAFKYSQTLNLETTPEFPMILIEGMNGCGKTTFLLALQIALFGDKMFPKSEKKKYESLITDLSRKDVKHAPRLCAEIAFNDSLGEHTYRISRTWNLPPKGFKELVQISVNGKSTAMTVDEWNELVDSYLPAELSEMFFFDGEKIEQMANPSRLPLILRTATEAFLGVQEIDSLYNDMVALERRTLSRSRSENGDTDNDVQHLNELQELVNSVSKQIEHNSIALAEKQLYLENIQQEYDLFKRDADRKGLALYSQSAVLKSRQAELQVALEKAQQTLVETVANQYLPLARLTDLMTQLCDRQELENQSTQVHATLELIKEHDQRLMEKLSKAFPQVTSLLGELITQEHSQLNARQTDQYYLVDMLPSKLLKDRIEQAVLQRNKALEQVHQLEDKLIEIQASIDAIPPEEQIQLILQEEHEREAKLLLAHTDVKVALEQKESLVAQLDKLTQQSLALEDRLRDTFRGQAKTKAMLEAGKRVRSVLSIYKDRLLAHKAQWLSQAITEQYRKLMRKKSLITSVYVNPQTYDVSVCMQNGESLPMLRLSAGERQLLATAVLSALIGERSCSFPVVVDTPLARLDRSHRLNMVKNFYATVSHQVMVLSTDEEISGRLKDEALKHIYRGYQFIYDETDQCTNVRGMR